MAASLVLDLRPRVTEVRAQLGHRDLLGGHRVLCGLAHLREPGAEPLAVAGASLALGLEIFARPGELGLGLLQLDPDLAELLLRGEQVDLRAERCGPPFRRPRGRRGGARSRGVDPPRRPACPDL